MKTIPLHIQIKALDCYIYGGFIIFVMQDGSVRYAVYDKLINRLVKKYESHGDPFHMLKVAFLRNEYYYSNSATALIKIPGVKEAIYKEWNRVAQSGFELSYDEIADLLIPICEWDSIPLDIRVYGMRLFIGCRSGLTEVSLNIDKKTMSPKVYERCFDGKVTNVNPKFGELVVSADDDGLLAASINFEEDKPTRLSEKNIHYNKSIRTSWSDSDIYNYESSGTFSFFGNDYVKTPRKKDQFWQQMESKKISSFGVRHQDMESILNKSSIKREDIRYCFHGSNSAYLQLKDGRLVRVAIKGDSIGDVYEMLFSKTARRVMPDDKISGLGKIISGLTIPKGCVLEFFDKILLQKDNTIQIIDEGAAIRVRTFMASQRYKDVLAITKEDSITIHAIDTLNLEREPIKPQKIREADVFDNLTWDSRNDPENIKFIKWDDDDNADIPF